MNGVRQSGGYPDQIRRRRNPGRFLKRVFFYIIQHKGGDCKRDSARTAAQREFRAPKAQFTFCPRAICALSARWRLRMMDLADPLFFSPARLADKRTLRPGPLVNHPAPEDEERIPRLWTPHLLHCAYLSLSIPLLNGVWSDGGWNKFHLAYRMLIYRGPSPC